MVLYESGFLWSPRPLYVNPSTMHACVRDVGEQQYWDVASVQRQQLQHVSLQSVWSCLRRGRRRSLFAAAHAPGSETISASSSATDTSIATCFADLYEALLFWSPRPLYAHPFLIKKCVFEVDEQQYDVEKFVQ